MSEYTEADMKFDSDPLMQEEDYDGEKEAIFDIRYGMKIQPNGVHARISVLEPPEVPPLEMTQYCFQLYMGLLPALHCFLNRGRVSMMFIHGICHDAGLRGKE